MKGMISRQAHWWFAYNEHSAIPDLEMIFIGAGHDEHLVRAAAAELPWVHHPRPKCEADKVPYCMLANVLLLRAAVGLTVWTASRCASRW